MPNSSENWRSFAASGWAALSKPPIRSCAGCRTRFEQSKLVRFVRGGDGWQPDAYAARRKQPGRGVYLCSLQCGERARKNKRYPGLAAAAAECGLIESLWTVQKQQ